MFLTIPSKTWPSVRLEISSPRSSARVSSSTARRETTILLRARSIFKIWNGCGFPIKGEISLTGRISTCDPGKNATAPSRSTIKPPLTRPNITPFTRSAALNFVSSSAQDSSRRAFSLLRRTIPSRSSKRSTKISMLSPTLISAAWPETENSLRSTRPSDFSPTSIVAASPSIATTVPFTTAPSKGSPFTRDSSRRSANFSPVSKKLSSVFT